MTTRVAQLDSFTLDTELFHLLSKQLNSISTHLPNFSNYSTETSLLLQLVLFKYTIWEYGATYGMKLQNLHLSKHNQLISTGYKLVLLYVIVHGYLWDKFQPVLYGERIQSRYQSVLTKITKLTKLTKLINYTVFLVNGKHPELAYNLLQLSISSDTTYNANNISYEYQNRQLIWNVVTEFTLHISPMFKIAQLLHKFNNYNTKIQPKKTNIDKCGICDKFITNAYQANCGHVYCYICLVGKLEMVSGGGGWDCVECGVPLSYIEVFGDVTVTDTVTDTVNETA